MHSCPLRCSGGPSGAGGVGGGGGTALFGCRGRHGDHQFHRPCPRQFKMIELENRILRAVNFSDIMAGEVVEESAGRLDYKGKMILAPMVKVDNLGYQSYFWSPVNCQRRNISNLKRNRSSPRLVSFCIFGFLISFCNVIFQVGTAPFRVLALHYGADIVYRQKISLIFLCIFQSLQ